MMKLVNNMFMLATCALARPKMTEVTGFSCQYHSTTRTGAATTATTTSQLMMSSSSQSRRDILSNAASVAAVGLSALVIDPNDAVASIFGSFESPITAQSAANKAAESYQGVYSDPKHPDGYRVIMASSGKGGGATMTLSDGVSKDAPEGTEEKTFKDIPVKIKDGNNELSFDFSFKGGPKDAVGTLSDDKQTITFGDGNTWTKNANKYDGIYKDPKYPNGYRIIRKFLGSNTLTEINDTGNAKDSKFIKGQNGSLVTFPTTPMIFFNYLGEEKFEGKLSLADRNTVFQYGTITFPDGTVWTRI